MFELKFSPLGGYLVGKHATGKNAHGFEYSVIRSTMSYGGAEGLYEFAGYNKNGDMVHEKVTGWLTLEAATEMAKNWKGE